MSYEVWAGIATALGWIGWALAPLAFLPLTGAVTGFSGMTGDRFAQAMVRLTRLGETICDGLGRIARWLALALVAVVVVVVVQRYVFGVSIRALQESALYLHSGLFILAAGSTFLADGHVRVDLFYSRLGQRGKAITDLAGVYLLLFPLCWLMLNAARPYVDSAWRIFEGSPETTGLPLVFALKTLVPALAIILALAGFSLASRAALTLHGRSLAEHERHEPLTGRASS